MEHPQRQSKTERSETQEARSCARWLLAEFGPEAAMTLLGMRAAHAGDWDAFGHQVGRYLLGLDELKVEGRP